MPDPEGPVASRWREPKTWRRCGRIVGFGSTHGTLINGDPCVVWDDEIGAWRMFYFCLPPGHAHAICRGDPARGDDWELLGPLDFTNGATLPGGLGLKPFVVLDPLASNRAARIEGRYCLLLLANLGRREIRRAWAEELAGPWTLETGPCLAPGEESAIDGKHVEAPSGYWFEGRGEMLVFYMATPLRPQQREASPLGSCQAAAVLRADEGTARKLGPALLPDSRPGHWAGGWIGGLQLVAPHAGGWVALINAGPTPPREEDTAITRDEPPPSLGGFAVTEEAWPVAGWRAFPEPIERILDVPPWAVASGEGVNLWRHHWVALPDGRRLLLYNSGSYAREQIFGKVAGRDRPG